MKEFENNALFWQKLDTILLSSDVEIDRPKNSHHQTYSNLIYPVDYGFLKDTLSSDMAPIDIFCGAEGKKRIQAIIVSADMLKKDCEIKIITGCDEAELESILVFLNQTEFQKTVLLRRGNEVPDWASTT